MDFNEKKILGKTGIKVGRLGISSSFGAPAEAYEEAFERGCNYFTWGTFIKGRSSEMKESIKNIIMKGERENLILAFFSYAHHSYLTEAFFIRGMKALGITYVDVLLLGYFPKRPKQKIIAGALKLKDKGLVRYLGLSSHNRKVFPILQNEGIFDIFHLRYNAAHRGAEKEVFPYLNNEGKPGIVSFTATRWGQLLKSKKMPEGEAVPQAVDCYRYVLSNPHVDICMMGAKNIEQMRENLTTLDKGPMSKHEIMRMNKIGDYLYKR
jgi:predicted aldo/keto reductase-like oxidoreductase